MKRKILVAAVISSLILLVGLSFQLGRPTDTHSSENALQTSNSHVGEELHAEERTDSHSEETTVTHSEETMEPDMPGMDHSDPNAIGEEADRPLKATLGTFGVATSIVLSGAIILRRRDRNQRELKVNARKDSGEVR